MMSEFWDPRITEHSGEYLDLILQVVASGNIDLITAIKNQFPQVRTADDLLTQTDHSKWQSLFVAQPDLLPASTNPGNTSHRADAFIRNMQTILDVPTTSSLSDALEPNDIPILQVSGQDSLAQFLQNYPGGFDFSADLNDTVIDQTLSQLFPSNATLRARTKVAIKWEIEWKMGKENARRLRSMSRHPGTSRGFKLYGTLKRKHVVLISRLRTGHCHLNQYLHRFNIVETSECECGAEKEIVEHYLLNCELYDEERDALRRRVGAQGMRTGILLGDSQIIKDIVDNEKTSRFKLEQR